MLAALGLGVPLLAVPAILLAAAGLTFLQLGAYRERRLVRGLDSVLQRRAPTRRNVLPGRRRHRRRLRPPLGRAHPLAGAGLRGLDRARMERRWLGRRRDRAHELAPAGGRVKRGRSRRGRLRAREARDARGCSPALRRGTCWLCRLGSGRAGPRGRSRTRWTHAPVGSPPRSSRQRTRPWSRSPSAPWPPRPCSSSRAFFSGSCSPSWLGVGRDGCSSFSSATPGACPTALASNSCSSGSPIGKSAPAALETGIHILSYGFLVFFAMSNARTKVLLPLFAGMAANAVAIVANGGKMPVSPDAARAAGIEVGAHSNVQLGGDRLTFLGDVFALPHQLPFANVFSVGDLLIGIGMMVLIVVISLGGGERSLVLSRLLRPLGVPAFRHLAAGKLVSHFGDWLTLAALIGWIYDATGSVSQVALLMLVRLAPPVLGGGLAAIVVDRLPRNRLLVQVEIARGTCHRGSLRGRRLGFAAARIRRSGGVRSIGSRLRRHRAVSRAVAAPRRGAARCERLARNRSGRGDGTRSPGGRGHPGVRRRPGRTRGRLRDVHRGRAALQPCAYAVQSHRPHAGAEGGESLRRPSLRGRKEDPPGSHLLLRDRHHCDRADERESAPLSGGARARDGGVRLRPRSAGRRAHGRPGGGRIGAGRNGRRTLDWSLATRYVAASSSGSR